MSATHGTWPFRPIAVVSLVLDDPVVLAVTLDPDGRRVGLSEGAWRHIVSEHPDLAPHMREIMQTVRAPDRRIPGRRAGEEWFYLSEVGPGRWLKAVVHYEGGGGRLVTAFARDQFP